MKKTLALVLSLALAVALCVGLFVVSSSADTAEKTIGETKAEAAWAEANKATSFQVSIGGKTVDVTEAITDKSLADLFKDVVFYEGDAAATSAMELAGKITFANGELTLDGVAANVQTKDAEGKVTGTAASAVTITPNGGLYVTVKGGDFFGGFNLNAGSTPLPDKSHLIITSPDHSTILGANGGNAITNTWGDIIFFGNVEINVSGGTGFDAIICRSAKATNPWQTMDEVKNATYESHEIVLDPASGVVRFSGTGNGAIVDNKQGGIVYGKDLMVICEGNAGAPLATNVDMVLEGNMKFFIENGDGPTATGAKLTMKDNVLIYHKANALASWNHSVSAATLDIQGGTIIADWVLGAAAAAPIQTTGGANAKDTTISGGKFFFNLDGTAVGNRNTGMLFKGNCKVNLTGGDFYINLIDNPSTASSGLSDAVVRTQDATGTPTEINFAGANFKINASGENARMFRLEKNNCAINFTAGSVDATVEGPLFDLSNAAIAVPVTLGADAKVSIVCGKDNDLSKGSFTVDGVAGVAGTKELKKGTVIAMTETAPNVLAAPTNVKVSDITTESAKVTWDAVKGATYSVTVNGADMGTVTDPEIALAGLAPSMKDVAVVVTAVYTDNITAAADAVKFDTLAGEATGPVVTAPTELKLVAANSKKAIISWKPVEGAMAYSIYVNGEAIKDGEAAKQVTDTTYVLTGLEKESDITITSWSIAGETEKSAALKVALAAPSNLPAFVEVTTADGTLVYLTKDNTSVEGVTFDPATGVVTLNNATIRGISATGRMTVVVKGTNTAGTGHSGNIFCADDVIFEGDGKLVIDADVSAYPVLGQSLVVFQGSVNVELNGGSAVSSAIHAARGTNDSRGGTGDTAVVFREKAVVVINVPTGMAMNIAGTRTNLISTDEAKVTINGNIKADAIRVIADNTNASDVDLSKGISSYTEFSGKTEFTITLGNCAFRNQVTIDTSAAAVKDKLFNKASTVDFIVKGFAKVDINAPGQTVYLRNDGTKNSEDVSDVCTLKVTENGSLKINNEGPAGNGSYYSPVQINSDENNIIVDGGSLEIISVGGGEQKSIITVTGKTTYTIGEKVKTCVFGKSAEEAVAQTKFVATAYYGKVAFDNDASVKYVASNWNAMKLDFFTLNKPTSDVNTMPFVAMGVLALVGLAAVVVLRKKFN